MFQYLNWLADMDYLKPLVDSPDYTIFALCFSEDSDFGTMPFSSVHILLKRQYEVTPKL